MENFLVIYLKSCELNTAAAALATPASPNKHTLAMCSICTYQYLIGSILTFEIRERILTFAYLLIMSIFKNHLFKTVRFKSVFTATNSWESARARERESNWAASPNTLWWPGAGWDQVGFVVVLPLLFCLVCSVRMALLVFLKISWARIRSSETKRAREKKAKYICI